MSVNIKFQLNSQSHKERWQSTVMIIMLLAIFGENILLREEKESYFDAKPSFETRGKGVLTNWVTLSQEFPDHFLQKYP